MSLEGQRLGRYHIVHLLGRGGMGDVYLAEDASIQQQVAIKVIRTDTTLPSHLEVVKDGFQREAKAIVSLDHPCILPLFDYGEAYIGKAPIFYLVMPYRREGSLADWINQRAPYQFAPRSIAHIIEQAGNALQHAHDRQIIHQDVKPSNFLLRVLNERPEQPDILLTDFGIAKFIATTASISHFIGGTPTYMSPEQSLGHPVPASDQYSLAIMTYELLTGRLPFHGNPMHVMYQHLHDMPEPPSACVPGLSEEIDTVLERAFSKRPEQRFPSVAAFASTFQQVVLALDNIPTFKRSSTQDDNLHRNTFERGDDLLVIPRQTKDEVLKEQDTLTRTYVKKNQELEQPSITSTKLRKPFFPLSRRTTLTLLLVGGVVIALSGTSVQLVTSSKSKSTAFPPTTKKPFVISSAHPASVTSLSWSSDGKYIASAGFDGTVRTWNTSKAGDAIYIYTTHSQKSMWAVAWSPNRELLVSGCADGNAYIWDAINGGSAKLLYTGHTNDVNAVQWAADSIRIVSGGGDRIVKVWEEVNDGMTLATHGGFTLPITGVAWSPDNTHVAAGSRDKTVRVWNALGKQGPLFSYHGHTDHINAIAWSPDGKFIASGSDDNTVQVWDATNGQHIYTYNGHTDHVNPIAWSPDSKRIASGSWDTTVQVWKAINGSGVHIYRGHTNHVNSVAWSPDSKRIASGGVDKTIQIWEVL